MQLSTHIVWTMYTYNYMLNVQLSSRNVVRILSNIVASNTRTLHCNIVPAVMVNYMHVLTMLTLSDTFLEVLNVL